MENRNQVPANWFIDVLRLGVAGSGLEDDENPLSWQADALCAQTDPEAFFPEKGGSTRDAKRICGQCNVRAECLEYALRNDERFGIWGGLSERERRRLKRRA
jgi:WhiB family redox-sensing transcriptional regulator